MIPRVKKSKFDRGGKNLYQPNADYSKFNEDPETMKVDRENRPYSPALMEQMETAHRDKDGWAIKPRSKPTRKP